MSEQGMTNEALMFAHLYEGVWNLMQVRNQMKGDAPWPEDSRSAVDMVAAATVGFLATTIDRMSEGAGRDFRQMLWDAVACEGHNQGV